ncbi:hypothetical protein LSCM4_06177 [Leishmania orientalis]|uniref:Uncharacterized protein n=1 Tax=Leishmania orientalis TaxID=2249476 RepID=A0A836KN15_9TRYP|nr:hypothetical protein LSCM4_06177 [Leishmania orientalis]
MRASTSMDAALDADGASVRASSAAPTPSARASRLRQPTLRWVESCAVPEAHSSSETPLPIRKSVLLPSPTFSPVLESLEMPLYMTVTMAEERGDHELCTVVYDEDIRANKPHHSMHRSGDYLLSCSAARHRRGSNSGDGVGGPPAHLIPAPPHHPRLSKAPQQQPGQQPVSTTSLATLMAPASLTLGETEVDMVTGQPDASGGSVSQSDEMVDDVLVTPQLSFLESKSTHKEAGESGPTSQRLSRRPRDLPPFGPTPIALPLYTAASQRQCISSATPVAALPSGSSSPQSLAPEQGPRRFSNRLHPQQKQLRRQRSSGCSVEDCNAAASATNSILATLTSATGTLASVGELPALPLQSDLAASVSAGKHLSTTSLGCLYVSPSLLPLTPPPPLSCTRGADARAPLAANTALSCSLQAVVEASAISPAIGNHVSGRNKNVNVTRVPVSSLFSAVGPLGIGPLEQLRPHLQAPPQGLLSPALCALPKGCGSPPMASKPHSPASSVLGNSSQGVSSNATAALLAAGMAATPASATSVGCADRRLTLIGVQTTGAHRENVSARLLEANVCAMFSGSAYADIRDSAEPHVLRALPVARTFIGHAAVESAVISAAASPLAAVRLLPGRAGTSCVPPNTQPLPVSAAPLVPKAPPADARPSPGTHERGFDERPRRSTETALPSLLASPVTEDSVEADEAGSRAPLSACSASPRDLREQISPMSFESTQLLRSDMITSSSSDAAIDKRDGAACRTIDDAVGSTRVVLGDVSSPPKAAAAARLSSEKRFRSSLAEGRHARDTGAGSAMSRESQVGATPRYRSNDDAVVTEEAVVTAVGIKPIQASAPFSPASPPPPSWKRAAFRFHSVLEGDEGRGRGAHFFSDSPLTTANAEIDLSVVGNGEVSVVVGGICARGESRGAESRLLATLLQQSAGAVSVCNASSRRWSCPATDRYCSPKGQHREPPAVGPRREDNVVDLLTSSSSRRELWTGLQLPHPAAAGEISFDNAPGQTLHSVTSLTRRLGYEAGMRRMNSDACFGTFISSANSIRSSLEDRQPSFYLSNTYKERSASPATQTASARTASPSNSSMRMRWQLGNRGSSVRGHSEWKRESRSGDGAVSRAASQRCSLSCGHDAALESAHSSCSSASHQTTSSSVSILSFAFESSSSATPAGSAVVRRSGAAVNSHSFTRARSWQSQGTESIKTLTSQPTSEETVQLGGWKENRKSQKGRCSGSSDASPLLSLALSNSQRHSFWQDVPQHFNAESPQWQENRRQGNVAKQRSVVVLQLADSPTPMNAIDEPERRRHQHQQQQCRSGQHHRRSANPSGSSSRERQ